MHGGKCSQNKGSALVISNLDPPALLFMHRPRISMLGIVDCDDSESNRATGRDLSKGKGGTSVMDEESLLFY